MFGVRMMLVSPFEAHLRTALELNLVRGYDETILEVEFV